MYYNSRRLRSSRPTSLASPHFLLFFLNARRAVDEVSFAVTTNPAALSHNTNNNNGNVVLFKSSFYDILLYSYALCLSKATTTL
jgi:hypothetical protein